jgi:hypothetical protein
VPIYSVLRDSNEPGAPKSNITQYLGVSYTFTEVKISPITKSDIKYYIAGVVASLSVILAAGYFIYRSVD